MTAAQQAFDVAVQAGDEVLAGRAPPSLQGLDGGLVVEQNRAAADRQWAHGGADRMRHGMRRPRLLLQSRRSLQHETPTRSGARGRVRTPRSYFVVPVNLAQTVIFENSALERFCWML